MSANAPLAGLYAPTVPNMLSEWPQRQRRPPPRPDFVPITHADMPPLTDVEVNAVTDYESRQDSRDLNFMTPPVPLQASDSSGITVAPRISARDPDIRSPTFGARDRTPEEHADPQQSKGKRKESVATSSQQSPKKRQREGGDHDMDRSRDVHAHASSSAQRQYEYDSDEIVILGHGMVKDFLAGWQSTSAQTQSTDEQPVTPSSLAEQEVDNYILASCEDQSTASESNVGDMESDDLNTAYIRHKCESYDQNKNLIDQCREDRERLCAQLHESLTPEIETANFDAIRRNRQVLESHRRVSEQLRIQIISVIKSWCKERDIPLSRPGTTNTEVLDTDAIRRLCDGFDQDRRRVEQLIEHQKQIVKKLAKCV